jgi:hypothetical protein
MNGIERDGGETLEIVDTRVSPVAITSPFIRRNSPGAFINQFGPSLRIPSPSSSPPFKIDPTTSKVTTVSYKGLRRKTTQPIRIDFPKNMYINSGDYTIHLPKLGDMITGLKLVANLNNTISERIIEKVDFIVKSKVIESLKGDFMYIDRLICTPLEKYETSNTLVNGDISTIDIPFHIVKNGFIMVDEPDLRISFRSTDDFIIDGYFLVYYTLIEDKPNSKFNQKVRQVQDISVVGNAGCNNITVNTAFTGPVYQLYFTIENLNTGTFIDTLSSVKFLSGGNFERFNMSGKYLRYIEPTKRYNGIPSEPIYLYTFCVNPQDLKNPSGQMNFSRLDIQLFTFELYPIVDPVKVTIWAQSHNIASNYKTHCAPMFETYEYTVSSTQNTITIPDLPINLNSEMLNSFSKLNISNPTGVPISNTFPLNYTISDTSTRLQGVISSPGYSNVNVSAYHSSIKPLFISNLPFTVFRVLIDPQTQDTIVITTIGHIYHQRLGLFDNILVNVLNVYDAVLDSDANIVVSWNNTVDSYGIISVLKRNEYTRVVSDTISQPPGAILYYSDYKVYCTVADNDTLIQFNLSDDTVTTVESITATLIKYCNSYDYIQIKNYNESTNDTNVVRISTGEVTINTFYFDGVNKVSFDSPYITFNSPFCNYTVLPNNGTGTVSPYTQWLFDSFKNFYIFTVNFVYSYNMGSQTFNSTQFNINWYPEYTDGYSGNYQETLIFLPSNVDINGIVEDPISHLLYFWVTGSGLIENQWAPNPTFNSIINSGLFTADMNGDLKSRVPNINFKSLGNFIPSQKFYSPSVFEVPLPDIRYPEYAIFDAASYYITASSNNTDILRCFKNFNSPPSWVADTGYYEWIQFKEASKVSNVYIRDSVPYTFYWVDAYSDDGLFSFNLVNEKTLDADNRLNFDNYTFVINPYLWRITALTPYPLPQWEVFDIALIKIP